MLVILTVKPKGVDPLHCVKKGHLILFSLPLLLFRCPPDKTD
ncbi:unnamed protein product [Staurois parvus]|uniref:Uncharacterized protein n=1 Tax=Staurois parvus TaxID=386267 RepID=A0ABN9FPR0_9NEOB|nr:unnamed protein product [Staurois parvus]